MQATDWLVPHQRQQGHFPDPPGLPLGNPVQTCFGHDAGGLGLIGNLTHAGMHGIGPTSMHGHVPTLLFGTFQLTFAVITAALISGAGADRGRVGVATLQPAT